MSTGFIKHQNKEVNPIVKDGFTHAICFGETGCGKTTSFMLRNINDRMQKNHGMLILDYKGTLHLHVKALAVKNGLLDKVVEIGSLWGGRIDLLKNTNKNLFLNSLRILNYDEQDPFWINSALVLIGNIYDALTLTENIQSLTKEHQIYPPFHTPFFLSIENINRIIGSKDTLENFTKHLFEFTEHLKEIDLKENMNKENAGDMVVLNEFINQLKDIVVYFYNFIKTMDKDSPSSGNYGVFITAQNSTQVLEGGFFSGKDDLLDMLEDGKIVVLKTEDLAPNAIPAVMNILYTRFAKRYKMKTPISLFIDEFHRSITQDSVPFIDVFREKRVELIAAVQNQELLDSLLGLTKTKAFMQNIISVYEYQEEKFVYKKGNSTYKAEPIFFSSEDLDYAQLEWQDYLDDEFLLPGGLIYLGSLNSTTALVKNIITQKIKRKYVAKYKDMDFVQYAKFARKLKLS